MSCKVLGVLGLELEQEKARYVWPHLVTSQEDVPDAYVNES